MTRNTIMFLVAIVAIGSLLTAALGFYRLFSYLAAVFILATFAVAAIERDDRELDFAPYTGLITGLGILFGIGLTGIWLLWSPGMTDYTYLFGLPLATVVYMLFLWLLPLLGAVYYATTVFGRTANDETVTEIMDKARQAQHHEDFPLSPSDPSTSATEADRGTEQ
jgi:hypothetical protein